MSIPSANNPRIVIFTCVQIILTEFHKKRLRDVLKTLEESTLYCAYITCHNSSGIEASWYWCTVTKASKAVDIVNKRKKGFFKCCQNIMHFFFLPVSKSDCLKYSHYKREIKGGRKSFSLHTLKMSCKHEVKYGGLCAICGAIIEDE